MAEEALITNRNLSCNKHFGNTLLDIELAIRENKESSISLNSLASNRLNLKLHNLTSFAGFTVASFLTIQRRSL